jgi:chromosome segregation ATPase
MHDLEARIEVSKDLEKKLTQQNTRLTSEADSIRERIQTADARLTDIQKEAMALSAQSARLVLERDVLLDKLETAGVQIADAKQEEERCRERSYEHSPNIPALTGHNQIRRSANIPEGQLCAMQAFVFTFA